MADRFVITWRTRSGRSIKRTLDLYGNRGVRAFGSSMKGVVDEVVKVAKEIVPVDTGLLSSSIHRDGPTKTFKGLEVNAVFGGTSIDYALRVHEDPNLRHAENKTHSFVRIPWNEKKANLAARLSRETKAKLRSGFVGASIPIV